ncbi:MAG: hypothetical protein EBS19_12050, partial [Spirochaetia bacterium]|nr:hypothetical protein [Spirochaetia bacterium]
MSSAKASFFEEIRVAGDTYLAGGLQAAISGASTFLGGPLVISSMIPATSLSTGSLVISAGGAG